MSRRLPILFFVVTLTIAGTFLWMGWHLFQQDREINRQGIQERLNGALETAGAVLARKLSEIEASLSIRTPSELSEDYLTVVFKPNSIEASPSEDLLYYPFVQKVFDESPAAFAEAERLEFQEERYSQAAMKFLELAQSPDPSIRARALVGTGRNLQRTGRRTEALKAYGELARMKGTLVNSGLAADLVGRYKQLELLSELDDRATCEREASALYDDLHRGRWRFSLEQYLGVYIPAVRRCFAPKADAQSRLKDGVARADGVRWLWEQWQKIRRGEGDSSGRSALWLEDRPVLVMWRGSPERLDAVVGGGRFLRASWSTALREVAGNYRFRVTDAEGHVLFGDEMSSDPPVSRSLADMQLPWTLHADFSDRGLEQARLDARRTWLFAGVGLAGALILTGGYFAARAFSRQLEVARLQSDFVSTVSHEFRTPLASLRQASELLADGRVSTEERRQAYYEALRSETERLQRLVEDLLDFRRMDAGVQQYNRELLSIPDLVRDVALEFSGKVPDKHYRIEVSSEGDGKIYGDRHALGRVVWNLLDNAVKYSPDVRIVRVETALDGDHVAIRVHDRGIGIAPGEQDKIFKKFVRSSSTKIAGIKGTGLGLAMAQQIVAAHGGRITVASQVGVGSTFTVLLPATREHVGELGRKQVAT
jgi:signal transduction histidine kinase